MLHTRRNILVSGGTGSGKTTLLNALIALIPDDERIVAIEDTLELRIDSPNCVRFEARGVQLGSGHDPRPRAPRLAAPARSAWRVAVLKAHGYTPKWNRATNQLTPLQAAYAAIDLHFDDLRREAGSRWLEGGVRRRPL